MIIRERIETLAVAGLTCMALFAAPANAAQTRETTYDGSKLRVHLAEKLTVLTQQVASAGCRLSGNISGAKAAEDLARAQDRFNRILDGLENGSQNLGVPSAESHRTALVSLGKVRKLWAPLDAAASEMIETNGQRGNDMIAGGNLDLLEATEILASDISGIYSNPNELLQVDALALHFAARQPMLAHKFAKEVCGLATNQPAYGSASDLSATVGLYEASHRAMENGMPAAGVKPPPTEVVSEKLAKIDAYWSKNLPALQQLGSGAIRPSGRNVETVARLASVMETDMNNVTTSYMIASPGPEEIYRGPIMAYAERELVDWITNPQIIEAIRRQNAESAGLSQDEIERLEAKWRAQVFTNDRPMVDEMLGRPVSRWMMKEQEKMALFVDQVIAMDNRGINVAQSDASNMYWQGWRYTFKETFMKGTTDIHIGEIEFDEAAHAYHSHVSMTIVDPDTGEFIGAITFGVDVQSLL